MNEDKLSEFVKLMSEKITDSDLELVSLGDSLGIDLVLFNDLRGSQDDEFTNEIRKKALEKMAKNHDNILYRSDIFFVGSIDFMVYDNPDGKEFFLLETNGGSNRGLSILTQKQQSIVYDGYFEAISRALNSNKRENNKILVLIGVPINDGLIHEKVIMLEYLRKNLKKIGYSVDIFNIQNFFEDFKADVAFLIADYKQISKRLSYSDGWVKLYDTARVNVLIGDGIARRLHDKEFSRLIKEDFRKISTIIVNPIFQITDDKSLTYLASYYARNTLEKYNLKYLLFTKAFNEEELINKIKYIIKTYHKPFIIKPNGGSGGAGVFPIPPNIDPENIKDIIEKSTKEFYAKFMKNRDPYPYTIQEMAEFSLIVPPWSEGKHTFDLRIYLAQKEGKIIPIGGLARIARGAYKGNLNKEEFVVNLSGFDGRIEVDRGRGISPENCKLLDLTPENFVDIFCIGCELFASIAKNHQKIMDYSDWDKIIGEN